MLQIVSRYFFHETEFLVAGVSISRVELSDDKRNLTVYWTTSDTRSHVKSKLNRELRKHSGKIRAWIAKHVRSLQPPIVSIKFDDTVDVLTDVLRAELKLREALKPNDEQDS